VGQGTLSAANYTFTTFNPGTLTVSAATPTISWANPANITYGTALGSTQLDATANVPGTFAYTPGAGTVLGAGSNQTLSAVFTPTDTTDYTTASASVPINVQKASPGLSLASPPPTISYDGTTDVTGWAVAQLTGVSGAAAPTGSPTVVFYAGTSPTGTPLTSSPVNTGTYTVVAVYAGDADYTAAQSAPVTFTIGRATATVTIASPPANIVADGTTDVTSWVKATLTGVSGAPAPTGGVVYTYYAGTSATGTPLSSSPITAGTYTVVATYGGNGNYQPSQSNPVTFTIQPSASPINANFQVNDGNVQRSMVDSLTVTFNVPVTLSAGAIALTTNTGTVIPFQLSTTDNMTYVLTFTGSQFIGGSLDNGCYLLTVNHALVNGLSGGAMTADQSYKFFRLFGDFTGSGTVTTGDLGLYKNKIGATLGSTTYGKYWYLDYYYDTIAPGDLVVEITLNDQTLAQANEGISYAWWLQ
jgi:hypothetical protein